MNRLIFISSLFITSFLSAKAQTNKFEDLAEKMLFNIRIYQTDSFLHEFVKKHVPLLANKPAPGGWTAYSYFEQRAMYSAMYSFFFYRHPFTDIKFDKGRLDIITREINNKPINIEDYQLWFFFNKKQEAKEAFDKLSAMFDGLNTEKNSIIQDNKKITIFKNAEASKLANEVEFVLAKDELHEGAYKLLFRIGIDSSLTAKKDGE